MNQSVKWNVTRVLNVSPWPKLVPDAGGGASQALGTLITSVAMPGSCFE